MDNNEFEAELGRRLTVIEDPSYDDPARRDLPRRDVLALVVVGTLVIALMWWWGYPA